MKNVQNTLSVVFKIRPGEGLPTVLLLIYSFFTGIGLVFLETGSYALFLTRFDIKDLPYVYIVSAVVTTLFGLIYSWLEAKQPFSRLLLMTTGLVFASVVAFYIALLFTTTRWVVMALIIWYNVVLVLTGLSFWSLANRMLNVRQGKRLFGLIGAGEIAAGIIGGLSVTLVSVWIGTTSLLIFSALGIFACFVILLVINRKLGRRIAEPEEEEEEKGGNGLNIFRNRYLLLIFSVTAISIFGFYFLDYVFYDLLETRFYNEEEKIAGFLGIFIAVIGVINLLTNAFLHSRLIERYGLSLGLLAVPTVVTIGTVIALAVSLPGAMVVFFWIIVVTKGFDEISRIAIEEPSIRILFQPFPPGQRLRVQTVNETMVEPLAGALVGGILILLTTGLDFGAVEMIYVIAVLLAGWIVLAVSLRRGYTDALTRALSKRRLSAKALSLGDRSSIDVLHKGLRSTIPGEVINSLNMLEDIEHDSLQEKMIQLLDHKSPEVRRHVLERIGALNFTAASDAIVKRLDEEEDPRVLGTALRTLCAISEGESFDQVYTYLEDPDMSLDVKRGAMAGLLSNGGIDGVLSAGAKLNALLDSENPQERKLAAQVLGEVGIASFYRPLLRLLDDENIEVRSAAVTASGRLKNTRLLPHLLKNFSVPDLSNVAVSAVTAFGEPILPELEAAFDREDQTRQTRIKLTRIMGRIGGPRAIEILKKKIDFSEEDIRSHVLSALVSCRYQADVDEIPLIRERIEGEVADATWTLSVLVDIGDLRVDVGKSKDQDILPGALRSEVDKNRKRIFALLALIYHPSSILQAQVNLESDSRDKRAHALEVLDNLLSQEIKNFVFPLVDDLPDAQRHSRLVNHFPQKRMSRHERLKEILARSQQWTSSWTKTCALLVVGKIATQEFYDAIISCLSDPDDVVRETAVWSLGRLNPDDLVQRLQSLKRDKSPRVAAFARFVINSVGFSSIPMGKSGYLTRSGRYTADLFASVLQDSGERRIRRCRAANILSRFDVSAARTALLEGLSIPDKTVRTAVLSALLKGQFVIEEADRDRFYSLLDTEVADASRILESILIFLTEPQSERLVDSLNQEIGHNRRRILTILALLCGDRVFVKKSLETMFYWYIHQETRNIPESVSARFRHLLEVTLTDPNQRRKILVLFQHRNPVRLRNYLQLPVRHKPESVERHLKQIAFGKSVFSLSWSRICALEMIVRLNLTGCVPKIVEKLHKGDEVIRATAAWALCKLDPEEYRNYAGGLRNDVSFLVSRTAKQLNHEQVTSPRPRLSVVGSPVPAGRKQ